MDKSRNLLQPSHTYSVCSGGDPPTIPKLTWQALRDFHTTHYHPSNARCDFLCIYTITARFCLLLVNKEIILNILMKDCEQVFQKQLKIDKESNLKFNFFLNK